MKIDNQLKRRLSIGSLLVIMLSVALIPNIVFADDLKEPISIQESTELSTVLDELTAMKQWADVTESYLVFTPDGSSSSRRVQTYTKRIYFTNTYSVEGPFPGGARKGYWGSEYGWLRTYYYHYTLK